MGDHLTDRPNKNREYMQLMRVMKLIFGTIMPGILLLIGAFGGGFYLKDRLDERYALRGAASIDLIGPPATQLQTLPLGSVVAWIGSHSLPPDWKECNGEFVPSDSPLKGVLPSGRLPNLNKKFIMGTNSAPLADGRWSESDKATITFPIDSIKVTDTTSITYRGTHPRNSPLAAEVVYDTGGAETFVAPYVVVNSSNDAPITLTDVFTPPYLELKWIMKIR